MPKHWDVIVVGAGTAGLMAALFAAGRGAKVILIEAAAKVGGTLHLSTGSFSAAGSRLQKERGLDDNPDRHFNECRGITKYTGDTDLLRLWIDNAAATLDWLLSKGLDVNAESLSVGTPHELYNVPRIVTPARNGLAYLNVLKPLLDAAIENGSITLKLNTAFTDLVVSEAGRTVSGITTRDPGGTEDHAFGSTVVLTTGGFSANETLWRDVHKRTARTSASAFTTGGAHVAVRRLGADLAWSESYLPTFGGTRDCDPPHEFGFHTVMMPKFRPPWEIYLNTNGERFMAEDELSPDARERALLAQPDEVFWVVYDQTIRDSAPPLFMWDTAKVDRAFDTHPDFQTATSLEQLASQCDLDANMVVQTIETHNAARASGVGTFGRHHVPAPIATPPYFAVRHYGVSVLSFAGIKTDSELRVLNAEGLPFKNLYAAGESLGMGVFGDAYLGGAMISSALTFGRLLGRDLLQW